MVAKKESIQQTTTGAWAASGTVTVLLDRIGLVTRYDLINRITPSATLATNQPDGLFRPFRNIQILAGGFTYFALPDDAGGFGATLLHYLNLIDKLGVGHRGQGAIVAPQQTYVPVKLTFHAGVRPKRRDGVDNPFDLTAFVPSGIESSPQVTWTTGATLLMDDAVTTTSAVLNVKAHRVLGSTGEIQQEMANQGVEDILQMIRSGAEGILANPAATGLVPAWAGQIQSPTAVATNYSLLLDAQLGGFLKRVSFIAQDDTADRPVRSSDELTQINLRIPEKGITIIQTDSESIGTEGPMGDVLGVDGVTDFGGACPTGIYPIDLRPYGPTTLEQIVGYDMRGRQTGYAQWGQTIGANATGDDIGALSERLLVYLGRLSNS